MQAYSTRQALYTDRMKEQGTKTSEHRKQSKQTKLNPETVTRGPRQNYAFVFGVQMMFPENY